MRGFALLSAAVAAALAVAGCGGGKKGLHELSDHRLSALVLAVADAGPGYQRLASERIGLRDFHPGPREDPNRFGREGGWKARLRKRGAVVGTPGVVVIDSDADVFSTAAGARQDMAAYRAEFDQVISRSNGSDEILAPPGVGEQTAAMTGSVGVGQDAIRFFTIAWRHGNVTASVIVQGFQGKVAFAAALRLARAQDARIAAAAG